MGPSGLQSPDYRALPRLFRRRRVLIIGCGDIGQRLAALAGSHWRVFGVARSLRTAERIRAAGATPLLAGVPRRRLQGLARWVVLSAPPPANGVDAGGLAIDPLTRAWTASLLRSPGRTGPIRHGRHGRHTRHTGPQIRPATPIRLVYLSTTGVYGDRQGRWTSEETDLHPLTERARRRVDAEQCLRRVGRTSPMLRPAILRVPGIYAIDRLPLKRLQERLPALVPADDVRTNHIHADDLARLVRVALCRHWNQRTLNVVDDSRLKMGDYLDLVAGWAGLPSPPRVDRPTLLASVTPMRASFMSESRQLTNRRMKRELRLPLRYPTVADFLAAHQPPEKASRVPI